MRIIKPGSGCFSASIQKPGQYFYQSATAPVYQLQPLPPAGFSAGASFVVELFSISVLPAPDFSPLHAVEAQPAAERPAPAIRLAMLSPAKSFRNSFLSISTSSSGVHKRTLLLVIHQKKYHKYRLITTGE